MIKITRPAFFSLVLLMMAFFTSLVCQAQSTAETAEEIDRELNAVKAEFATTIQTAIKNPEKLQSGQTQADCVNAMARLDQILTRSNETIDLLAKRESDLAAMTGVGQAEKIELKQAIQSQRKPLESNQNTARQFKNELTDLIDNKLGLIAEAYSNYYDIAGPEKAREKVESHLSEILALHTPRKPKPTETPISLPSKNTTRSSENTTDLLLDSTPNIKSLSRTTPKLPRPVWKPKDKLPKEIKWHGVAGRFAFIGSSSDGSVILVPAEDASNPLARKFWVINKPYSGGANVLFPSQQRRIIDIPHLNPLIIMGRGSSPGVYHVTMP